MLTLHGPKRGGFCDGISRRQFLQVGGLGICGLPMADQLRLTTRAAGKSSGDHKAVIIVYLNGGASQLDMFDMKPKAPAEFRGEFKPAPSKIPGVQYCELLPRMATLADKYSILNGMQVVTSGHSLYEASTGYGGRVQPKRPAIGAVVSKFSRSKHNGMPTWVSRGGDNGPEYLGSQHAAFTGKGGLMSDLRTRNGIPDDRTDLLKSLDKLQSDRDANGDLLASDTYTAKALEMLSSTKVLDAFDLMKEPEKVKARYPKVSYGGTGLLLALRLAEAGVSCVTTYGPGNGKWDTHKNNFKTLKDKVFAHYDQGIAAMIEDLYARGLDKKVLICIYSEFGRTPRINKNTGRDHYPQSGFVQLVGGGLKMGRVVGDTGRRGDWDVSRSKPYTIQNLIATMYHVLGIDPSIKVPDNFGRPQYLLTRRDPIAELL